MVPQEHWPGNCANIQLKGEELRARENRLSQPSVCRSFCCWEEILQVNAANQSLLGGGGVDGAIHRAAGLELLEACSCIPEVTPGVRCPTGFARITGGFKLPVSHIIHTVGPVYYSMEHPEHLLSTAYKNCLAVARDNGIKYIAFPAISCGIYGYPFKEAAEVSLNAIGNFADDLKEVHFVLFDQAAWDAWTEEAGKSFEQI